MVGPEFFWKAFSGTKRIKNLGLKLKKGKEAMGWRSSLLKKTGIRRRKSFGIRMKTHS